MNTNKTTFAAIVAIAAVLALAATITVKPAFAIGGNCSGCASSFTPSALSSGLSGTGAHGVEKIFAPGQEAQVSGGTASTFAPGIVKQTPTGGS